MVLAFSMSIALAILEFPKPEQYVQKVARVHRQLLIEDQQLDTLS